MKPKLIVGGVSKSGTTALYCYLLQHPEICLSEKKELHYFSRQWLEKSVSGPGDRFILAEIPKTFDEYLSYFQHCNESKVAIDISPSYLFHYQSADKIKKYLGLVKIIFILRNPIEKSFSQYMHNVSEGLENLSFEQALAAESKRESEGYSDMWLYKKSGLYADAIEYFQKVLGSANVKLFYYEEYLRDPASVLREICKFAGVNSDFEFKDVLDINRSGRPKSVMIAKLLSPNTFTYLLRRIIPNALGRNIRRLLKYSNIGEKPAISEKTRTDLSLFFADEISRVESIVGHKVGW